MQRVLGYIDTGIAEGAHVALGGKPALTDTGGYYVEATIFDEVRPQMRVSREEIFGPVLAVTPFHEEAEAIVMANDSIYGLAAAVWTSRYQCRASALERTARRHRVGQQLRSIHGRDTLRRLQAVRLRPRSLAACHRQVRGFEDHLDGLPIEKSRRSVTPPSSSAIMAAPFSATMMVGALVLPDVTAGKIGRIDDPQTGNAVHAQPSVDDRCAPGPVPCGRCSSDEIRSSPDRESPGAALHRIACSGPGRYLLFDDAERGARSRRSCAARASRQAPR